MNAANSVDVRSESGWQGFLESELGRPVRVGFTRARKTPIQVRPLRMPRGALEVRMHRLFAEAPADVPPAVASWIRSGRRAPRACARLDAWIDEVLTRLPPPSARHVVTARGAHHDLERMAADIYATELASEFGSVAIPDRPRVSWGQRTKSRTRRSLRLGSFSPDGALVRIHPVLDQAGVPDWFVRYVVFHELLHAAHPPRRGADDRWVHHGPEFRRRERRYPDYRRALEWEERHLAPLIRSARNGSPLAPVAQSKSPAVATPTKPKGFWQRLLF